MANPIIVLSVLFQWALLLDALVCLSTVLILALSIYSIRSVIFIYRVTRARANNNFDIMPTVGVNRRSTAGKVLSLHEQGVIADRCGDIGIINATLVSRLNVDIHSSQYL